MVKIKKLSFDAVLPTKKEGDAGLDLYSLEDYTLEPFERHLFVTNIAAAIPPNYYGHICDRSGNALKKGLHVMGGIVDSTYRGNIGVILINLNYNKEAGKIISVEIKKNDRIAQLVVKPYLDNQPREVAELPSTLRGAFGWGSSGD